MFSISKHLIKVKDNTNNNLHLGYDVLYIPLNLVLFRSSIIRFHFLESTGTLDFIISSNFEMFYYKKKYKICLNN